MKKIILFLAVIALIHSSYLSHITKDQQQTVPKTSIIGECISTEINAIYKVIASCQATGEHDSANCIIVTLWDQINGYFGAHVQASDSLSAVKYLTYDNCVVTLTNYGKFGRKYEIWKQYSSTFQYSGQKGQFKGIVPISSLISQASLTYDNCTTIRMQNVKKALGQCQKPDIVSSVTCVSTFLKANLNENWNVFSKNQYAFAGVDTFYYDCRLSFDNYGQFNRYFYVWKASPN